MSARLQTLDPSASLQEVAGPMRSPFLFRRERVAYVRQAGAVWEIALVATLVAAVSQTFAGATFVLALLSLLVAWEWLGQRASSLTLVPADAVAPIDRSPLVLVEGLTVSAGLALVTVLSWGWWMGGPANEPGKEVPSSVAAAALLGGMLVFQILRQAWRFSVAVPALVVMLGLIVWPVAISWGHPQAWPAEGLTTFARLLVLLATAAAIDLWAHPIGQVTRWPKRLMRAALLLPVVAGVLVIIEIGPATLAEETLFRRWVWFVALALCLAAGASVFVLGWARRNRLNHWWRESILRLKNQPLSAGWIDVLAPLPPLLLVSSVPWNVWCVAYACYFVAGLARGTAVVRRRSKERQARTAVSSS